MHVDTYQTLAARTRCPQEQVLQRLDSEAFETELTRDEKGYVTYPVQHSGAILLHGVIGLTGEVGELASAVEKYAWYQRNLDRVNVIEELGDALWYIAEICDALNIRMGDVMDLNIQKLKKRYPEKYSNAHSAEENRNREAEVAPIAKNLTITALDDGVVYPEE